MRTDTHTHADAPERLTPATVVGPHTHTHTHTHTHAHCRTGGYRLIITL